MVCVVPRHQTASMANDFVNGNMLNTILCKHTLSLIQMPILSSEGTFLLPTYCFIVFGNIVTKLIFLSEISAKFRILQ